MRLIVCIVLFITCACKAGAEGGHDSQMAEISLLREQVAQLISERQAMMTENTDIKRKHSQLENNISQLTVQAGASPELSLVEEKHAKE